MSFTFAHDHRFVVHDGTVYTKSGLPKDVLNRYAIYTDKLVVLCRKQHVTEKPNNIAPVSDPNFSFIEVPNLRSIRGLFQYFRASRIISDEVKKSEFVIARLPSTFGAMTAKAARKHKTPYVVEVVGNAYEASFFHGSKIGKVVARLEHYLTQRAVRLAPHAIYITKSYLQDVYPTDGTSYSCSNVNIEPAPEDVINERINKFCVGPDVTLGLIGSLNVAYKGHGTAIRSLSHLKTKLPDKRIKLQLVGSGSQDKWIRLAEKHGVLDSVEFVGALPAGKRVMDWLDEIDIQIQPSTVEGQGRSIIEGMSRGCPVVASNAGGIPELLQPEFLADPTDAKKFSDLVSRLVTDQDLAKEAMRNNWTKTQEFRREQNADKRANIFTSILAEFR